jgi:glutamate receptor, ionotropic, plant
MMPHCGHHLPQLAFLLYFLISLLLLEAQNTTSEGNNVTDVKVGVILDTSSWNDGISWSCMQLALEDFYSNSAHLNYTTRISLVLRDLKSDHLDRADDDADSDAFGAAVAGCLLLFIDS